MREVVVTARIEIVPIQVPNPRYDPAANNAHAEPQTVWMEAPPDVIEHIVSQKLNDLLARVPESVAQEHGVSVDQISFKSHAVFVHEKSYDGQDYERVFTYIFTLIYTIQVVSIAVPSLQGVDLGRGIRGR